MKILLRKNIENVGKRGEIVEVADGYARNYLFPKNFALKPIPQNVKQLEVEKRHHVQQEAEEKEQMEQMGRRLRPVAVLVSAGFGAHRLDPLGGMAVTEAGFARMTRSIVQAADAWAGGRVLSVLEGGWHLEALASCARAHVAALAGREPGPL